MIIHNYEYLDILRRKTMEKAVVEEIKEGKQKEKEEKQTKLGFVANQTAWKWAKKRAKVEFIVA